MARWICHYRNGEKLPWLVWLSGWVPACKSKGRQFNSQSRAEMGKRYETSRFADEEYKELSLRPVHWTFHIDRHQVKFQVINQMYESGNHGRRPRCKKEFGNIQNTYVFKASVLDKPIRSLRINRKEKQSKNQTEKHLKIYRSGSWGGSLGRNMEWRWLEKTIGKSEDQESMVSWKSRKKSVATCCV